MTAAKAMREKYIAKRNQLWDKLLSPEDAENSRILWEQSRDKKKGFVNIPRAMPLVLNTIDHLSRKASGIPVSSTYFALWCRDFGTGFVEVKDMDSLASEAGFDGVRRINTIHTRLKALSNEDENGLGLIRTLPHAGAKYRNILMLNPFLIIYIHYRSGMLAKAVYDELFARCIDVGDKDLEKMQNANGEYYPSVKSYLENL